jgi:hypothetical protein
VHCPLLSTCGSSLGPGASCSIGVVFDRTTSDARNGVLTVTDSASGSPQAVPLSGTGQDFALAASGPATATVVPGQTATYTMAVTPGGGFKESVNLSCSGAPTQSTCMVSSPVTLDGVNPSMATISVVTNASTMGVTQPVNAPPISGAFSLWLGVSGILGVCMLGSCLLSIGITMTACGGGNSGGGTQAGTYTLTVTGASGGTKLTNITKLILVVQ